MLAYIKFIIYCICYFIDCIKHNCNSHIKLVILLFIENNYYITLDSTLPYEIDNLIVVSWKANRLKNNSSPEELKLIAQFYSGLGERS